MMVIILGVILETISEHNIIIHNNDLQSADHGN